jgi:anti-anti-sigma factor
MENRTWELRITTERTGNALILTASGRIGSEAAPILARALDAARKESPQVIVDLDAVDYVSGPGLTVIHDASRGAEADGGKVIVCGLRDPVRIAFDLAGLLDDLAIVVTRAGALDRLA